MPTVPDHKFFVDFEVGILAESGNRIFPGKNA
jgi:hypothetical protein